MPMKSIQCAICGENEKIEELYKESLNLRNITKKTFSARRTPDRMHYRFVKCLVCGLIFSNPILEQNKIIDLYKKSTFDYGTESEFLKKTYGYYLLPLLKNAKREKIKLLDIGCGNGFFLEEAKDMGVKQVYGIEPGRESVKQAPKWLQKTIKIGMLDKKSFKQNTYDIVCCFHTLDHIVDPNAFLQIIYSILKKGGKALFIVHDTSGLSVKLFGEKSPIFDIEHIYLFNKSNLAKLFKKNNFTVIKNFDVKNNYPLQYWIRMTPLPKILKNPLIAGLKKIKREQFPLSLRAGNIGIVVKK